MLAQDEATCVVWGMPGSVAQRGLADMILPLQEIAPTMTRLVHRACHVAKQLHTVEGYYESGSHFRARFYLRSSLVHADSAIVLDAGKEYLVVSRLGSLAVSEGCSSLAELVSRLRTAEQPELRRKIVEALTTNETSFFRDLEPFELLRKSIIPALVETRQIAKTLTIWCAACSTGQEPYSIAMMIRRISHS